MPRAKAGGPCIARMPLAIGNHDTNYDQRQQQVGRSVPRHCAFHQKHQLEGETMSAFWQLKFGGKNYYVHQNLKFMHCTNLNSEN
jgi:hypothetical protein